MSLGIFLPDDAQRLDSGGEADVGQALDDGGGQRFGRVAGVDVAAIVRVELALGFQGGQSKDVHHFQVRALPGQGFATEQSAVILLAYFDSIHIVCLFVPSRTGFLPARGRLYLLLFSSCHLVLMFVILSSLTCPDKPFSISTSLTSKGMDVSP